MMLALKSQACTTRRSITSARTFVKKNLMKILRNIPEMLLTLLLNLEERRAEKRISGR
jgi:hypothetical protein